MKRRISIFCILAVFVLTLVACGSKDDKKSDSKDSKSSEESNESTDDKKEEDKTEDVEAVGKEETEAEEEEVEEVVLSLDEIKEEYFNGIYIISAGYPAKSGTFEFGQEEGKIYLRLQSANGIALNWYEVEEVTESTFKAVCKEDMFGNEVYIEKNFNYVIKGSELEVTLTSLIEGTDGDTKENTEHQLLNKPMQLVPDSQW